jgi:hypothetical protein
MPIEAAIALGSFSIVVPQSQQLSGSTVYTEGITYYWQLFQTVTTVTFYFLSGQVYTGATHQHTDTFWYTGSVHDASSVRLDRISVTSLVPFTDGIHAVAPNLSTVDFTDLVAIPSQQPYLDISLYRIAELLTGLALYRDRISAKFNIRGAYSAATSYLLNDVVNYNGNSYVWINPSSSAGHTPPASGNDAYWFLLAAQGAPGGTGATIVGYSSAWSGSSQAAARGDVYSAFQSFAPPDLSAYALIANTAPRNNAIFTGSTKRGALSYPVASADLSTEVPTAQYVESAIDARNYGVFTPPLIFARRVNQQASDRDVSAVIFWDNRVINTGNILDTSGRFTVPAAGNYLIFFTGLYEYSGSAGSSSSRATTSLILSVDNGSSSYTDVGNILFENDQAQAATWRDRKQGIMFAPGLTTATNYVIRSLLQGSGLNATGHSISPGGGGTNNYFLLWKIG